MALQHLEHHHSTASYPGGGLDGYTSYSSDSSAPRTPSPREESGSYPAVFTPEMHNQPWAPPTGAGGEYQYNPQEGREYESKAPTGPPSANGQQPNGQDHPGAGPRRNTFPSVQYDREDRYGPPPPSSYQLPPPGSAPMYAGEHEHNHHYPPPPSSGSPHPPYHEYDHYGRPPPPPHHYYAPPPHHPHAHPHAHMGMPPHPMSHHPHLGMTYISPHTGLPVQHTDDAASKETQYLRRRCFNCHTTEPPSWRRSTLNPGKIVCNKCGLYERTHLRPRPLRFDELRAGNKARKAQPGGAAGGTKKKGVQSPPPPPATAPAANGSLPPLDEGKGEPRDYNLVRRSSVGSSGSSSAGNSDWDSTYPSNPSSAPTSHPNTTYSSPATQSYPLPQRTDSHSPQPDNGIRLPSASLTSSPLIQHASISPHLSSSSHLGGSPQMLHHTLHGRSPPRKSHTYPTGPAMYGSRELNGSNHSLVGESPPA